MASLVTPFEVTGIVLKTMEGCAPALSLNFPLLMNLYRHQKIKAQGLPSSAKRSIGSKLSLFFPIDRSNIIAGLPKVKVGSKEIPLLVRVTTPPRLAMLFVLSVF